MNNTLGLFTLSAALVIAGCGDDGNTGGSPQGGSPSGGSPVGAGPQGAGPQGAGPQGGDGPVAGQPQGGASQGGDGQGGAVQGGDGQGGAAQGGNGSGGAGQGGSGGDGSGGAAPLTCQTGCETIFDCGLEDDSLGNPNCPGAEPADGPLFIPGCVQTCMSQMALLAIIDPNDCEGTIDTLSTLSSDFEDFCQNGL